jgi:hypothetical protein
VGIVASVIRLVYLQEKGFTRTRAMQSVGETGLDRRYVLSTSESRTMDHGFRYRMSYVSSNKVVATESMPYPYT